MAQAAAFAALIAVVGDLVRRGRRAYAAGVKAELQRDYAFNERTLGYRSFGAFLEDAQAHRAVALGQHRDGYVVAPDLGTAALGSMVSGPLPDPAPPGATGHGAAGRDTPAESVPPVRPDLWRAFLDHRPNARYLYAMATDAVHALADDGDIGDVLRDRYRNDPEELRPIPCIEHADQLAWAKGFAADATDEDDRLLLGAALATRRPLSSVSAVVRSSPALAAAWSRLRTREVRHHGEKWAVDNGLAVSVLLPRPAPQVPSTTTASSTSVPSAETAVPNAPALTTLQTAVCHAVRRMSDDELRRLSLPVHALVG